MKKILIVFLIVFLIFMNIVSCNDTESLLPQQALVCDYSDSIKSAKCETEYIFADSQTYDGKNVAEKVEITIDGQKHIGSLQHTQYRWVNYFPVHCYRTENGFDFELDDKGMLISAFWGSQSELLQKTLSLDECKQIAIDFMKEIVDVSEYTVTVIELLEDRQYKVLFQKYCGAFETSDQAIVVVNMNGNLFSYSSFMLGRVVVDQLNKRISQIDLSDIETAVTAKLDCVYTESKAEYDHFEYEKKGMVLTVLKNGSWAFVYTIGVKAINEVGIYDEVSSGRINLMVELQ